MKKNKTEFIVVNAFSDLSEAERKEKINKAIRTLCVTELENIAGLEYYEKATFLGDALSFKRGGIKEC